jgi:hypothetical protein
MGIVMTVTIHLKAILMVETAVHLMKIWSMGGVGMNFVPHVNVFSPLAKTIGPQKNVASVTQKNVRNQNHVRRTARILAIYATVKNLARIKKVPSIARRH